MRAASYADSSWSRQAHLLRSLWMMRTTAFPMRLMVRIFGAAPERDDSESE